MSKENFKKLNPISKLNEAQAMIVCNIHLYNTYANFVTFYTALFL